MAAKTISNKFQALRAMLFRQTGNSVLIVFRIAFGFLMAYHVLHFMWSGKLYHYFIAPPFTFTFIGFEWLQPLPGNGMYLYFILMAALALLVMAGAWYRLASVGLALMWTAVYLMQKSGYNNHYYLMLLLSWLMSFLPAHRVYSVDAKRRPQLRSDTCGYWVYLLFITQSAIIYFYAAIAKLNADWLNGKFIALQFAPLHSRRLTGMFYANEYFQWLVVYGGFLLDLLIVPLLLWKRTRNFAFLVYCGFHLFNSYTFRIGIFPWLSIAIGLFFLPPEQVRRFFFSHGHELMAGSVQQQFSATKKKWLPILLSGYLLIQVLLPLRPMLYPGNVFWTEEGYRMSWKMMLRTKTGKIHFKIQDPGSGQRWRHDPAERFATSHVNWIAICPDIAWQYAQHLKKEYGEKGYPGVAVYAIDSVSLNKNPPQLLIDTTVDLAGVAWKRFGHNDWIVPDKK